MFHIIDVITSYGSSPYCRQITDPDSTRNPFLQSMYIVYMYDIYALEMNTGAMRSPITCLQILYVTFSPPMIVTFILILSVRLTSYYYLHIYIIQLYYIVFHLQQYA